MNDQTKNGMNSDKNAVTNNGTDNGTYGDINDPTIAGVFKDMREQMSPSPAAMARLMTALDTEHPQTIPGHQEISSASESREGAPSVKNTQKTGGTSSNAVASQATASHTRSALPARRRRFVAWFSGAAAAVLVLIAVTFTLVTGQLPLTGDKVSHFGNGKHEAVAEVSNARVPASYDEVYGILSGTRALVLAENGEGRFGLPVDAWSSSTGDVELSTLAGTGVLREPMYELDATASEAPAATDSFTPSATAGDYSETNVQVEGIDEGDIVKTDGKNIYALSRSELIIFKANGAKTTELSRTQLLSNRGSTDSDGQLEWSRSENPVELFVHGSVLIAIIDQNIHGIRDSSSSYYSYLEASTKVAFFDISDPQSPQLVEEFYQSGSYYTARLDGDVLYLISSFFLNQGIDRDDPATYVPLLGEGNTFEPIPVTDICVMPEVQNSRYSVVTSFDVLLATRIDQKSVLGSSDTVYMSHENLYLGSTVWVPEDNEPYREGSYMVREHYDRYMTQLIRMGIEKGTLTVGAQCILGGQLLNQFSLDEYDGNLRLAVTHNDHYSFDYTDQNNDIVSHLSGNETTTNSVFVLNPDLNIIGSIEGLAADERIYSVRFTGAVGYMVTFRQTDPLFTLDLSDPTKPRITSELKIPGFSTYLHPFTEGRLLGLGYNVEEQRRNGMKMSMFDTSDPFAVKERFAVNVETFSSEALSNHKAVLVDAAHDLIGFPGYDSFGGAPRYFVYGYDDTQGFVIKAKLELDSIDGYYYGTRMRGMYIGDYLYVYTGTYLRIYDLSSFESVGSLMVEEPSEDYFYYPYGFDDTVGIIE